MKQALLFKVLIGIMIVLNISLLAFVFFRNSPRPPRRPVPELIADILSLTDEQKARLHELGKIHHENQTRLNKAKNQLFLEYLKQNPDQIPAEEMDIYLKNILEIEEDRVLSTYQHLQDIRELCSEEQLEKFPKVIEQLFGRPGKRPGGAPPHQGPPPPMKR